VTATAAANTNLPRLLAGVRLGGQAPSLAEHERRHGPLPSAPGEALVALVEESGLRGRGGGGFPTAVKLRAVRAGRRPVVVANGAEGEPLSLKDKLLLRAAPHLVLDGLTVAAAAIGAGVGFVAVARSARGELHVLRRALDERRAEVDRVSIRLVEVPDAFVAGEETALVGWLSGKPARPTAVPPRPFERGVRGRPTLVQNVETLAHLALIARHGARWFRELGTADEPGSTLVTLQGAVRRAGVYEVPLGLGLRDLVSLAGGATAPPAAVLVGGYFGTWLTAATARDAVLLDERLAPLDAALGARTILLLPSGVCGLAETARIARYLADESAGQCGPCVHGLAALAGGFERLAEPGASDVARLHSWLDQVLGRGGCRHPDGAVRFLRSALRVFADELEAHAAGRCCAARRGRAAWGGTG
jgi:NADH:ubiquinone oxidoreductase subunit F (NADH-binding)